MNPMEQRNQRIKVEYLVDKIEIPVLARIYGMSEKRITQILDEQNVALRRRERAPKPISRLHTRIGLALYDYRVREDISLDQASIDLQISKIRLRRMEKGEQIIDVLELQNIASYIGTTAAHLMGETK